MFLDEQRTLLLLLYSGQRPAGMEEGSTGSQGPQRIGELVKEG
jgi:hypothetical protein